MVIDIHAHLGFINQAPFWAADAATLERYAQQAGVDYLCASSARSLMYDVAEGNRELAEALRSTQRLLGYAVVNPVFPGTIGEIAWLEKEEKMRGIKVHPDYHGYDMKSPRAWAFLSEVARAAPLMLFHCSCMPGTGFAEAREIIRFAEAHPQTNIIMAHLAGIYQNSVYPYFPNFEGLERVQEAALPNLFVDTAHHLMYVYPGVMERVVELAGTGQLVFGTDVPLQGPMQIRFAREVIEALPIPAADREAILSGNARKLLKLA